MKKIIHSTIFIGLGILSLHASAKTASLAEHISEKINVANEAFEKASAVMRSRGPIGSTDPIEFKQFMLAFAPQATFGINSVLSIQVAPEITFVWEKIDADN